MKRILLLAAAVFLLACKPAAQTTVELTADTKPLTQQTAIPYLESTPVPEQTADPDPETFAPDAQTAELTEPAAEEPTPAPTPKGLCGGKFADRFSETPVKEERAYRSSSVGITIETYTDHKKYGKSVTYYVADICVQDVTSIKTAAARGDFGMRYTRPVREIAADVGALLAIDGDTYTHVKKSFVIRNGELYRSTLIEDTDLCVLYRDGRMETKKWGTFTMQQIIDADPWQVWGFGPALLDANGNAMEIKHRLMGHNPRAAIGYYEPGHYCFVIVDGRGESSGVTLSALSRMMADLGCKAAYNLDGGASAQMYWDGEIINHSSNEGRTISDIIYILPEP